MDTAATLSSRPLLSIVIATYNRANDLDRCIRSVLAEPGDFFEVVIGDDGSPDHTPEIVKPYLSDPRVRHYRNETNLGMRDNYLKIARFAQGEYLFILTDDDYVRPGALEKVAQIIRAHPEVGYILSDLPTMDERTSKIVDLHRTFKRTTLIVPSLDNMAHMATSAWVLSRQVLKKDWIDWDAWERFRDNIFFPIIVAGRLLLSAPAYYLADALVTHTWFNTVFWHSFGRNRLEIELNLASDQARCLRAILHDYAPTQETRRLIAQWEMRTFRAYLYLSPFGFYDLIKATGWREANRQLRHAFSINPAKESELVLFPFKMLFARIWFNVKQLIKRLAPPLAEKFKAYCDRLRA